MKPTQHAAIMRKLITMETSAHKVTSHRTAGLEHAYEKPAIYVAVERNLSLLEDLARDVALLVAGLPVHRGDRQAEAPIEAAVACGALEPSMVRRLSPAAGPYHIQMQFCMDTDPQLIPDLLEDALATYNDFVAQIIGWVAEQPLKTTERPSCTHLPT